VWAASPNDFPWSPAVRKVDFGTNTIALSMGAISVCVLLEAD